MSPVPSQIVIGSVRRTHKTQPNEEEMTPPPPADTSYTAPFPGECERLRKALCDCHKRIAAGPARNSACRHLNRGLAQCLVSFACPDESEAVRSLCSSGGTALKRSQCQQAQLALSVCLSSHQE